MNKQRRKSLEDIIERLESAKADIEDVRDEETEAYDNMPDSLRESERGEAISENCDELDSACEGLEGIIEILQECIER